LARHSGLEQSRQQVQPAQVAVRLRIVRLQGTSCLEALDCLLDAHQIAQRSPSIEMPGRKPGREGDGSFGTREGLAVAPQELQRCTPPGMRLGIIGSKRKRTIIVSERLLEAVEAEQRRGLMQMDLGPIRP
jgi:hypothetical protein